MVIYVCSPYRGNVKYNTDLARAYCRFVYEKGYVPFAPHLHNTQFLDDNILEQRKAGIRLGLEILKQCNELWCFGDALSEGMRIEIEEAKRLNVPINYFTQACIKKEEEESI